MKCPTCGAELIAGHLYADSGMYWLPGEEDCLLWRTRERVEILPFHSLGRHKYRQLNRPDPTKQTPVPTREETEGWKERLRALGCRHLQE